MVSVYKARGAFLFGRPMNKFIAYLKNVQGELKHVVWPSWQAGVAHTALIVLISACTAVFLGALDYGFTQLVASVVSF